MLKLEGISPQAGYRRVAIALSYGLDGRPFRWSIPGPPTRSVVRMPCGSRSSERRGSSTKRQSSPG